MTLRTEHISQCSRIKARKIDLFLVFRTEHISQCSRISAGLSTIWDEFRTEHISQCSRMRSINKEGLRGSVWVQSGVFG